MLFAFPLSAMTWLGPSLLGQNLFSSKKWPLMASWRTTLHTCGEDQLKNSLPNKNHSSNTKSSTLGWLSCPKENLLVIWLGRTWRKSRDCLILMLSTLKSLLCERLCWLSLCLRGFSGRELANMALADNIPCLIITPTHLGTIVKHSCGNPINL